MGGVIAPSASVTRTSVPWQIHPPGRPALFQSWASPSSNRRQKWFLSFPPSPLCLLDWSQYTAAPGAITDMLRPSVKPLSATYQHTDSPL